VEAPRVKEGPKALERCGPYSRHPAPREELAMSPYSAEVCLLVFLWVFGIASFFEWRRLKKLVERERNRFLKSDETGEK
jgi:hypothetical protein